MSVVFFSFSFISSHISDQKNKTFHCGWILLSSLWNLHCNSPQLLLISCSPPGWIFYLSLQIERQHKVSWWPTCCFESFSTLIRRKRNVTGVYVLISAASHKGRQHLLSVNSRPEPVTHRRTNQKKRRNFCITSRVEGFAGLLKLSPKVLITPPLSSQLPLRMLKSWEERQRGRFDIELEPGCGSQVGTLAPLIDAAAWTRHCRLRLGCSLQYMVPTHQLSRIADGVNCSDVEDESDTKNY